MSLYRVNYDELAPEYDRRYTETLQERGKALLAVAGRLGAEHTLEVGCGTGHWLVALHTTVPHLYGLDPSEGMLHQAQKRAGYLRLVRGTGTRLPFARDRFDLVFCVDAIHHFGEPREFMAQAFRLLKPGGGLAIVGSDPRQDHWYVYDYFESVYATDLARFTRRETLAGWMSTEGFGQVEFGVVEHIQTTHYGRQVLKDPFLRKNSCSQLALLSAEAYEAGIAKIKDALGQADSRGETPAFRTELFIHMLVGYKPTF